MTSLNLLYLITDLYTTIFRISTNRCLWRPSHPIHYRDVVGRP